jgi:hypothetical protein
LLDLAFDPDQEKYMTIGTDIDITSWLFQDIAECNVRWLAAHPWIEVTTFSDLLKRNWTPVDHGDLGLAPDQPLEQYPKEGGASSNDYFWQNYYGSISDGHSPLVTKGDTIEAYFEYVPYLRDGQRIPSGRKMGDDRTSGSIVYETLHNLRVAPNNSLTSLAWHSYFMNIADQISHAQKLYQSGEQTSGDPGGKYLHPSAKVKANFLRQVNKIVAAAQWADEAAKGTAPDSAQALKQDLDFDGEDEYILKSEKVFAVFENDGGRLEYAFAYDPLIGPVQLVAPFPQFALTGHTFYEDGEKTFHDSYPETAFEDISYAEGIKYSLLLYNAELGEGSITFTSPDNKFRKTFTLVGNIIRAHYEAAALGGNGLVVGFKLPVNLGKMFSENWWESLEKINTPEVIGWQCGTGGYAVINLTDAQMIDAYSFADSPVREEMKERGPEDDPYPVGHWLPFPINQVRVSGSGEFNFSLTLSAGIYTSVGQSDNGVSRQFGVCQNYPNPFNPKTVVEYQLPHAAEVEISIFNLQGQKVATLVQGHQTAGSHKITWDGKNESGHRIASGAYLYQMKAGDFVQVKKMLFLR